MTIHQQTKSSISNSASVRSDSIPSMSFQAFSTLDTGKQQQGHSGSARLIGSATAGFVELMLFHPVDTIAKRLMSHTEKYIVAGQTLSNLNKVIFRQNADAAIGTKLLSLFPGLGFAAGYKISQRVYKFGGQPVVHDFLRHHYADNFTRFTGDSKRGRALMQATAGSLIGIGEICLLPLDVLKIKAQTNPQALKNGVFRIFAEEGLRKLYAGAGWTAARNAPGSFALFGGSALCTQYVFHLNDAKSASFAQFFVASCCGSIASIAVSSPLDTIKTRIQNKDFNTSENGMSVLTQLLKNEGPSALFKGLTPKLLMVGPKLIFSFTVAQYLIARLEQSFQTQTITPTTH